MSQVQGEATAERWFAEQRWGVGQTFCPRCAGPGVDVRNTTAVLPYRCCVCHRFFSVKSGSFMDRSKLPYATWRAILDGVRGDLFGADAKELADRLRINLTSAHNALDRLRAAVVDGSWLPAPYDASSLVGNDALLRELRRDGRPV